MKKQNTTLGNDTHQASSRHKHSERQKPGTELNQSWPLQQHQFNSF